MSRVACPSIEAEDPVWNTPQLDTYIGVGPTPSDGLEEVVPGAVAENSFDSHVGDLSCVDNKGLSDKSVVRADVVALSGSRIAPRTQRAVVSFSSGLRKRGGRFWPTGPQENRSMWRAAPLEDKGLSATHDSAADGA